MPETLSYADAVRLLGGQRSKLVDALDAVTGGLLLSAAVPVPAVLGWFDARVEFIRLSHKLVAQFTERRSGLSRYDRTERLAAAHRVLVVTAFFEALEESDLPFRFADLELNSREQAGIVGRGPAAKVNPYLPLLGGGVDLLLDHDIEPLPHHPDVDFRAMLTDHYGHCAALLRDFVCGLAVWERLRTGDQERFGAVLRDMPERAVRRYRELFARLAGDFPEVAFWGGLREHAGTQSEVRALAASLAELERLLARLSTGAPPDERRAALHRAHAALLSRPVVETGDTPPGLTVPTLGAAYQPPPCRTAEFGSDARPSDESWWARTSVRDDLPDFLAGYLTGPGATRAPLLVLGQPGSGKSLLTKVLAARLPPADFLPVRVLLREVPAAADLQDQIEYAIRQATGERLDWPALVRSAGDALPVVLLDGFDELLQATGVSQTDYLRRVAAFQRREADQGRPVAVVVTSRTSVADRAEPPAGAVALRLEPFDDDRVAAWLAVWNGGNAGYFARRGVAPLDPATVLEHGDLAGQPLLLLMLALYDADGNALRKSGRLRRDELYERLLRRFAEREVSRHRPGLPTRDLLGAVEEELRRLSVVAFAMFNRAAQWITEADLEADLATLVGTVRPTTGADLRAPLRPAELVLGRFFFVHRAQASRDGTRLETYEFLHATFGEYLIARLTWQMVAAMVAREKAPTIGFGSNEPVDDDLLHALLSFAALSGRAPIVEFLVAIAGDLAEHARTERRDLLLRLFREVHHRAPGRRFDAYRPRTLPVPTRYAAYSANLLLLAVCAAGSLRGSDLYPDGDLVTAWHRQALLWRSQLSTEDWTSLVDALLLQRRWAGPARELVLSLANPATDPVEPADVNLVWTYNLRTRRQGANFAPPAQAYDRLRRVTNFQCGVNDDLLLHTVEPVGAAVPGAINLLPVTSAISARTAAHDLLQLLATDEPGWAQRIDLYLQAAGRSMRFGLPGTDHSRYLARCLDRLATDPVIPPSAAVAFLDDIKSLINEDDLNLLGPSMLRCALAFVGREAESDKRMASLFGYWMDTFLRMPDELLVAQLWVRLAEVGHLVQTRWPTDAAGLEQYLTSARLGDRVDLLDRFRCAIDRYGYDRLGYLTALDSADGGGDGEGAGGGVEDGGDADEGPFVGTNL
nr:hypothetical protein [Micromonospora sp. DSM 115978]